jgi:hypothetical protein
MKRRNPAAMAALMLGCAFLASAGPPASAQGAALAASTAASTAATTAAAAATGTTAEGGSSLETAASKAGNMGRKIAMSLIGLGLALAAIRLAFRRNFKEASGVVVLGLLAVLLASPMGESLLQNTVGAVFGS